MNLFLSQRLKIFFFFAKNFWDCFITQIFIWINSTILSSAIPGQETRPQFPFGKDLSVHRVWQGFLPPRQAAAPHVAALGPQRLPVLHVWQAVQGKVIPHWITPGTSGSQCSLPPFEQTRSSSEEGGMDVCKLQALLCVVWELRHLFLLEKGRDPTQQTLL